MPAANQTPGTAESRVGEVTTDGTESGARVWGACGVEDCRNCWPLYNEANEPITDNFGEPL